MQLLQQQQAPPQVQATALVINPNMATILAMMQAQQVQTTAVLRVLQGGNKPSLSFPTWDGQSST
jgi:N-acetylglutamate synthase/N-acetylornithine aminotransferase